MRGAYAPAGVVVPANPSLGRDGYHGLYLVPASALSCCWIAPHADIDVKKPRSATMLVAGVALPDFPVFTHGQSLTFGVRGESIATVHVGKGQQMVRMHLPPAIARMQGLVPLHIVASIDYVPARAGIGSTDARHLAASLLYIYFI